MAQMQIQNDRVTLRGVHSIRLLTLAGVLGSLLFVFGSTIDGFLRPGYSPIHQVVSDLGIGENAWILNTDLVVFGLLFMFFALGFSQAMRKLMGGRKLMASTLLLLLTGAGAVNDGLFAEYNPADPTTAFRDMLHSLGFLIGFVSLIIALFVIGLHLRKDRAWRGYGWYSILTSLVTLLLLLLPYVFPLYGAQLGGLNERMLLVVAFAWHVVTGWRLFALEGPQQDGSYVMPITSRL
ncbi:MAG TPA: DUF998 domain-containing protein [Ktedonobacteraceae bacterium]